MSGLVAEPGQGAARVRADRPAGTLVPVRSLCWLLLLGLAVFAYHALIGYGPAAPSSAGAAEDFLFEPAQSSPGLIFGLTAWMLWNRRRLLHNALGARPLWLPGAFLLGAGLALHLWAHYTAALDLAILSLSAMILAAGALLGGARASRSLLLPSILLLLAIPIPAVLVNYAVYPLQLHTAQWTHTILGWIGIESVVYGDQILTEERIFQVIETCAGLRGMATLTMAALVYVELFHRRGWRALALVLCAPLVGSLVNTARVLSIVLNPYSDFAAVHTAQGLVMVVVGVLLIAGFDAALQPLARRFPPRPLRRPRGPLPPLPRRRVALLAGLLVALGAASLWMPRWKPEGSFLAAFSLPPRLGDWKAERVVPDTQWLGTVGFSTVWVRELARGNEEVEVFVGADFRLNRAFSLISDKTALPGSGWRVQERNPFEIEGAGPGAETLVIRSPRNERRLVVHYFEGVASPWVEVARSAFALDRSPLRREGVSRVVRLSTAIEPTVTGRGEAARRLREVLALVRAGLEGAPHPPVARAPRPASRG